MKTQNKTKIFRTENSSQDGQKSSNPNKNGSSYKWIRGGRILTATEDFYGEILTGEGQILALGTDLQRAGIVGKNGGALGPVEEINATGLYLLPGGIDPHTHLDLPFMGTFSSDDFETGTVAALNGGTTCIIDFAMQNKGSTLNSALNQWHEKAQGKSLIDYSFHIGVTDLNERTQAEIPGLVAGGITSFKCFMAYKGALMVDDGMLFNLMCQAKELGALVSLHCENGELIDVLTRRFLKEEKTDPVYHERSHSAIGEGEASARAIALSREAGHPIYIVHLTCEEALFHVRDSRIRHRHPILAETCPQYLLLDRSLYEKDGFEGAKWVMSPPLRTSADQEALWAGIREGFIQVVATDHCPFNVSGQKDMGRHNFSKIPNGMPGIENRINLIHTAGVLENRISLNRFVQVTSTNAAKIFGLYPKKGTLMPGSDADIVLYDPTRENTISVQHSRHRCDYSAFEGFKTRGEPVGVLLGGQWALKDGKILTEAGAGRFIRRNRFDCQPSWQPTLRARSASKFSVLKTFTGVPA